MAGMNRQDRNMIGNRAVPKSEYSTHAGRGAETMHQNDYTGRFERLQDRLLREATGGLCGFDRDGNIVLAVDPARVRTVGNA